MKQTFLNQKIFISKAIRSIFLLSALFQLISCEKDLENITYGDFSSSTFFKTAQDANAAVSAMYTGLMENGLYSAGWGSASRAFRTQASMTTDESVCYWDDGGTWNRLKSLNFTPDFEIVTAHYTKLVPYVSQITVNISKIQDINMNDNLKKQYIAELKALRAYYSQILYLYYGPVPVRINPDEVNNLDAPVLPKPSKEAMVGQIIKDYTEAIDVLPNTFTGVNYGRFSRTAALTGMMKLYMQEKRWQDAVNTGNELRKAGLSLMPDYASNFTYSAKGGNSEIILAVVCSPTSYAPNLWLAHALPTDYIDPSGIPLTKWGGYRMPWKTYDKFDQSDKRLSVLLQKYPTGINEDGAIIYRDARVGGDIGAVMIKYGPDPTKASSQNSGVDYVVFRYADVILLLSEALNMANNGPTAEAYGLLNEVRARAGLPPYENGSLNRDQFMSKIQDERLFELWAEGVRRDDLIRWGLYIQRAKDDGYTVDNHLILYPLPRSIVVQSGGVIAQNNGYD